MSSRPLKETMEATAAPFNSLVETPRDLPSETSIYFCSICNKPFNISSSRDRHFRYCGRHKRVRPRSCQACNAAKTKCSFDEPCSRCLKKNIECVYDNERKWRRPASPKSAVSSQMPTRQAEKEASTLPALGPSFVDAETLGDKKFSSMNDMFIMGALIQSPGGMKQPADLTFDELLAFDVDALSQPSFSPDASLSQWPDTCSQTVSWCSWMRSNVSLAVVTNNSLTKPNSNQSVVFLSERTQAQHSANLIIQSLRSFPTMMLRRETFPWFIHSHSQGTSDAVLPEALSNCMSIAQMFVSRTPETKRFLRQSIRNEHSRFDLEMYHMSGPEILAVMQASMIYLIMYIIDYSLDDEEYVKQLFSTLLGLYSLFKSIIDKSSDQQTCAPIKNSTWEDWVYVESRRRFSHLWLLVGFVVCVRNGTVCDPSQSYRILHLPSSKHLWEAPTRTAWESEFEAQRIIPPNGLATLGDLIDAQRSDYTPSNARKLDQWNSGVDNLGCLLNLVESMQ